MTGNLTYTTVHAVVCICPFRWVCMFGCLCVRECLGKGGGVVGIIWACQCTTVSCFVAVMDSHKMKGRMEAENLVACCLKKLTWVAVAAGHEGQVFTWDAGELIHCGSGEGEAGWWDSGWVKSSDSTRLWLGHCLLLISSMKSERKLFVLTSHCLLKKNKQNYPAMYMIDVQWLVMASRRDKLASGNQRFHWW